MHRREAIKSMLATLAAPSLIVRSADQVVSVEDVIEVEAVAPDLRCRLMLSMLKARGRIVCQPIQQSSAQGFDWEIVPGSVESPE